MGIFVGSCGCPLKKGSTAMARIYTVVQLSIESPETKTRANTLANHK